MTRAGREKLDGAQRSNLEGAEASPARNTSSRGEIVIHAVRHASRTFGDAGVRVVGSITTRRRHEHRQRIAIPGRHGQTEFGAPPEHVVRKTRPFLCHQVVHLRARQLRSEGRTKVGPAFGVAKDGLKTRAVGGDQTPGLILGQKAPALAGTIDLCLEPGPCKIASRQGRRRSPARRHRVERRKLGDCPFRAQPRGCHTAAKDGQQRRLAAPDIDRHRAIPRVAPARGVHDHVGAGKRPDHV